MTTLGNTRAGRALAVLALLLAAAQAPAADKPKGKDEKPPAAEAKDAVAVVDGVPITAAELEKAAGNRLFQARNEEYRLKRQILDETIEARLLEREAKARGITADALVKAEITDKVVAVTEAEVKEFYETNRQRIPIPEEQARPQIQSYLKSQREQQRRGEFLGGLRQKAAVKVLIDAPRVAVTGSGPAKGGEKAPVTIVEFSDFQCPFCARAQETLKAVQQRYGDKVRIVFRDMPLLAIHKDAAKAAEAAHCAEEQGKFWELHDWMFAHQAELAVDSLKKQAAALGLDSAKFDACLDGDTQAARWKSDLKVVEGYGLSAAPAFIINGRVLIGARPLEQFTDIIDDELERAGLPRPAAASAAAPAPAAPESDK